MTLKQLTSLAGAGLFVFSGMVAAQASEDPHPRHLPAVAQPEQRGNVARTIQRGDNHQAVIEQTGEGNRGRIIQIGEGRSAILVQEGEQRSNIIQINRGNASVDIQTGPGFRGAGGRMRR